MTASAASPSPAADGVVVIGMRRRGPLTTVGLGRTLAPMCQPRRWSFVVDGSHGHDHLVAAVELSNGLAGGERRGPCTPAAAVERVLGAALANLGCGLGLPPEDCAALAGLLDALHHPDVHALPELLAQLPAVRDGGCAALDRRT